MQSPPPQQDDSRRTTSPQPDAKAPVQPTVGVYDRPEKTGGMNMMTILLIVIALIIVGAIVWTVVM